MLAVRHLSNPARTRTRHVGARPAVSRPVALVKGTAVCTHLHRLPVRGERRGCAGVVFVLATRTALFPNTTAGACSLLCLFIAVRCGPTCAGEVVRMRLPDRACNLCPPPRERYTRHTSSQGREGGRGRGRSGDGGWGGGDQRKRMNWDGRGWRRHHCDELRTERLDRHPVPCHPPAAAAALGTLHRAADGG